MAPLLATLLLGAVACLAPAVTAAPAPAPAPLPLPLPFWNPKGDVLPKTMSDPAVLKTVTLTLSNGSTTLPSPPSDLALKLFTVGVGFQNYSCDASNSSAAPAAVGAVATLINAGDLMPLLPAGEGQSILDLAPSLLFQVGRARVDASILPKAGLHYFSHPKTPTFDLTPAGLGLFYGGADGDIAAPANATTGPNGAVDWLALTQNPNASFPANANVKMVYRIFTASGKPPSSCDGQASTLQMPYSAQYFFYG